LNFRTKDTVVSDLEKVRSETLDLVEQIPESFLFNPPKTFMGPIIWDLAHIAKFEEIWILKNVAGLKEKSNLSDDDYNAIKTPRKIREDMDLPSLRDLLAYMFNTRNQVLDTLDSTMLESDDKLLKNGYVFDLVIQHEYQHQETILQSLALFDSPPFICPKPKPQNETTLEEKMVLIPAGDFILGTAVSRFAYDNELPSHNTFLEEFLIDSAPVSNERYLNFIENDGYNREEYWSERGMRWKIEENVKSPLYWYKENGTWFRRVFDKVMKIPFKEPVIHVSYWEAEAFANFEGKRLPTEQEWEKACRWDPNTGETYSYPWGEEEPDSDKANIGKNRWCPSPVGSYEESASPSGCHQMLGDVYEWTSSSFLPYDGFEAFPYDEYSAVHFGEKYKVLRGASWATSGKVARATFRNWDFPHRRQLFSGFRCAMDSDKT